MQLMPADRLLAAQGLIKVFDAFIIVMIVAAVLLSLLALGLAGHRVRMLLFLAIGVIISFLLARLAIHTIEGVLVDGIANGDVAGAVRVLLDATFESLRSVTIFVLIATVIVAIVAFAWSRPGRRSSTAAGASPEDTAAAAASRSQGLRRIGIGAVIVILAWIAVGPEVALLGAALAIALELIMRARSDDAEAPADEPPAANPPGGATTTPA